MSNEQVVERVRETGEWISRNAENIVGSDGRIEAGGLKVSFTVENDHAAPKVVVRRVHLS